MTPGAATIAKIMMFTIKEPVILEDAQAPPAMTIPGLMSKEFRTVVLITGPPIIAVPVNTGKENMFTKAAREAPVLAGLNGSTLQTVVEIIVMAGAATIAKTMMFTIKEPVIPEDAQAPPAMTIPGLMSTEFRSVPLAAKMVSA